MRTADKADPDPDITTVLIHIWPLCLVSGLKTKLSSLFLMGIKILVPLISCPHTKSFIETFSFEPLFGDHPGRPSSPGFPGRPDRRLHLLHPRVRLPLDVCSPDRSEEGQRETVKGTTHKRELVMNL